MGSVTILFFVLLGCALSNCLDELEGSANREHLNETYDRPKPRISFDRLLASSAQRFDVCLGVPCLQNQACEEYIYGDTVYPICYDRSLNAFTDCRVDGKCLNGGECSNDGKTCDCPENTHGITCETISTLCSTYACPDNGLCVSVAGGGGRCVARPLPTPSASPCAEHSCFGDGCECVPSCMHENGYFCKSALGYIGKHCDIGPPKIFCYPSEIRLEIPQEFVDEYRGLNTAYLYVSPNVDDYVPSMSCRGSELVGEGIYVISIDLSSLDCGQERTVDKFGVSVYNNQVWINRNTGSSFYDLPVPVFDFSCTYKRNYRVVTSLKPVIDTTVSELSGLMSGNISIELCKVSTCFEACPRNLLVNGGAVYTVGERIHLSTTLELPRNAGSFSTEITEASLSCSSNPDLISTGIIMRQRCAFNRQLSPSFGSRTSTINCMSFKVPRMKSCTVFYIHLKVIVCSSFSTSSCKNGAPPYKVCTDGLVKRSAGNYADDSNVSYHVIGPFVISREEMGTGSFTLNYDNETTVSLQAYPAHSVPMPSKKQLSSSLPVLLTLLGFSCFILIFLIVFVCLFLKRRHTKESFIELN